MSGNTPPLNDIKTAIDEGDKETLRRLQRGRTFSGEPNMKCFNAKLMQEVDNAFVAAYTEHVGKKTMKVFGTFLGRDEESGTAWRSYIKAVLSILQRHESSDGSILPPGFTARAALSLCWVGTVHPFPVPTASVIEAYHHMLDGTDLSIKEVCINI